MWVNIWLVEAVTTKQATSPQTNVLHLHVLLKKWPSTVINLLSNLHLHTEQFGRTNKCRQGDLNREEKRNWNRKINFLLLWLSLAPLKRCLIQWDTDLEQRSDVHIKSQVSKARGNDFGTSVVTVLTHLCHQQTRVPALVPLKICDSKKKKKKKVRMDWNKQTAGAKWRVGRRVSTCCEPRRSLPALRTRCGTRRSPSWCWLCAHQTRPSWHQWFHLRSI